MIRTLEHILKERRGTLLSSFPSDVVCKYEDILSLFTLDDLSLDDIRAIPELDDFSEVAEKIQREMNRGEAKLNDFAKITRNKFLTEYFGKGWKQLFGKLIGQGRSEKYFMKEYFLKGKCNSCEETYLSGPFKMDKELSVITKSSDFLLATYLEEKNPILCGNDCCENNGGPAPAIESYQRHTPVKELLENPDFPVEFVQHRTKSAFSLAVKSILLYHANKRGEEILRSRMDNAREIEEFAGLKELETIRDVYAAKIVVKDLSHIPPLIEMISKEKKQWAEKREFIRDYLTKPKPGSHPDYRTYSTVVTRGGIDISVHVLTKDMLEVNERGSASHDRYYKKEQYAKLCGIFNHAPHLVGEIKKIFAARNGNNGK